MADPNNLSQQILYLRREQFNVDIRKKHRNQKILNKRLEYMHKDTLDHKQHILTQQQQKLDALSYENDFEDVIDSMDLRLSNIALLIHTFTQQNKLDMLTITISKLHNMVCNHPHENQKITNMLLQKKILQNIVGFLDSKYEQHEQLTKYIIDILSCQELDDDIHLIYESMIESIYSDLIRILTSSQKSFQKIIAILSDAIDSQFKEVQSKIGQDDQILQVVYDNQAEYVSETCTFIESCFQQKILKEELKKKYVYVLRRMLEHKQNQHRLDEIVDSLRVVGKWDSQLIVDDPYWLHKVNDMLVSKFSNAKLIRSCLCIVNLWLMSDKTVRMQLDNNILEIFIELLQQSEVNKIRQQLYFNLSNILGTDDYQIVKTVIQQNFTSYIEKTFENEVLKTKQEMVFCAANIMQSDDDQILSHVVQNTYKECLGEVLLNYENYSSSCVIKVMNAFLTIFQNIDKRYTENIEERNKGSYELIRKCQIEEGLNYIYRECKNAEINDKCFLLREKIDKYIPENQADLQFY